MWIKDVRLYEIDVYKDEELIYSGNSDEAPEEIKKLETKKMTIAHKRIKVDV